MQICFVMQRLFNGTACDIIRICLQTMDELYPMTWKLHNYLKKELEAFGIGVVTTRTNQNTDRALYERGAASKGCNLFISVHSNAVGNGVNENVDYPVAYVLLNGSSTDIGLKLAKVVEAVMGTAQSGRTATRQGTNGEYYGVLRGANAVGTPGIILEHSFHTNTRATKWLSSDSNLQKLAKAEAECVASYYGVTRKEETTFTKIMGNAVATVEQMTAYIKAKNPDVAQSVVDMIPLYLSEGKAEGVRGDIAFAQSCIETGNFGFCGSAVTLDQNNFCGMGVASNGMRGNSFDTPQLGIRAQVQHLKAYVNKNREAILHQIDKLRVPLNENSVRFKYVLVIGRNAEKDNSEKRRAMFAEKSDNDIRVMTYDSLVSQCESVPYNGEKIILSTWKEQGFKIKKLPKQEISTSLFAYLKPEYLQISERDIEILKEQDYQIDIWLSGRSLSYNDKYDAASLAERTTNPLTKAVLLAEAKNNK